MERISQVVHENHTRMRIHTHIGVPKPHSQTTVMLNSIAQIFWPLTCDEIAEFSVESCVVIRTVEPHYHEIPRDILQHWRVVHTWKKRRGLVIHVQYYRNRETEKRHTDRDGDEDFVLIWQVNKKANLEMTDRKTDRETDQQTDQQTARLRDRHRT